MQEALASMQKLPNRRLSKMIQPTRLLLYIIMTLIASSCMPQLMVEDDSSELEFVDKEKEREIERKRKAGQTIFKKAQPILNNKCLSCHGSTATHWGVSSSSTEKQWIENTPDGLLKPGEALDSSLVKLMLYSVGGTMPQGYDTTSFPKEEFDIIVAWINSIPKSAEEEDEVLANGSPVHTDGELVNIGDRNYVFSILKHLFGDHSSITSNIRSQLIAFGGPCPEGHGWGGNRCLIMDEVFDMSQNSTYEGAKDLLHSKHYIAVDLPSSSAKVLPESSPVREGYRTFVCEELSFSVNYNADFSHPIFKAISEIKKFEAASSGSAYVAPNFAVYPQINRNYTNEELKAAYQLFNNFREPNASELTALKNITSTAQSAGLSATNGFALRFEPWRYVLYSLCDNPGWQIK